MKKGKFLISLLLILTLTMSITVNASAATVKLTESTNNNAGKLVDTGYTEDGIYYEVYETPTFSNNSGMSTNSVITVHVTRKVVYYAIMEEWELPESISWSEKLDSYTTIRGTLYLDSFVYDYDEGTTTATYEGDLVGSV
ncbi:hypothetical protein Ana3638_20400 [Anaerocolumna sedimenticola]|uniref:Uncharacterized protein n=1 Tax=Anaerocolumna sedimenticola TaxID=2696063 RepID=A0A6P1TTM0_9FIRM|nr:hypothetical protein [Anaerocolumna sedimenticola]QHQ62848.1 hypothetical protein Ana3638_20400 [Anaerocolumna sedimenticola]